MNIMVIRLWSFHGRDTKLEKFWSKLSTYSKEIIEFFRIGVVGSVNKNMTNSTYFA